MHHVNGSELCVPYKMQYNMQRAIEHVLVNVVLVMSTNW